MFVELGISHKGRKETKADSQMLPSKTVNHKSSFDTHSSHVVPIVPQAARIKLSPIFAATEGLHV